MRRFSAILVCLVFLCDCAPGAEPQFPYTARVALDEVEVRCGPGWDYYATARLKRGDEVQVYRHEPGGWLAIRPPKGSYSWLAARHLNVTDQRSVGQCAVDGAVAWVGAMSHSVRQHKWQVRLERDELIEILGQQPLTVGPGFATETYYKIAPPAGEFRWIHAQNAAAPGAIAHRSSSRTIQLTEFSNRSRSEDNGDARRVSDAAAKAAAENKTLTEEKSKELAKRIEQLNVELSLLVTRQISQWNLDSLKRRAEELASAAADTPLARHVRAVKFRITEFETLQRRYQSMSEKKFPADAELDKHGVSAAPRTLESLWQNNAAPVGSGVGLASAESTDSRYDAEGWLMPVHSTKRVAPPFAVLDDDGQVRCYVTPEPGLNLRRYLKKYVGLIGERRYVAGLRAHHVTASRVVKQKTR